MTPASTTIRTVLDAVTRAPDIVRGGEVELNRAARRMAVRGTRFTLPAREFELLEVLMANSGRAVPRDVLLTCLWGFPHDGDPKTLDTHILRLRKKIEADRHHPTHIHTVRGFGYLFDPPEPTGLSAEGGTSAQCG